MNGINKIDIPQLVRVRKYPVDVEKLKQVLRDAKLETDLTNSRIAFELDVPITTVEHWFRKDNGFSIPDEEIWYELKNLLCIDTCEFDESITTFEEKEGVYEKSNRYYLDNGISPTITSTSANEKIITGCEQTIKVLGNYMPSGHDASRIVDEEGLAPTVKENHGTVTAVAMRGRYEGNKTKQNIEISDREYANAITTVQKDSMVTNRLRIRKLTPKECWRLMGFDDDDFEKAEKVNSNTQLYKQAGNSIVVNVLEKIFKNLFCI